MGFYNFQKKNKNFIFGIVQFFITVADSLEKTTEGSRYDFIADKLEEIFDKTGIGVFELKGRSDIDSGQDGFHCHTITFGITDFHIGN